MVWWEENAPIWDPWENEEITGGAKVTSGGQWKAGTCDYMGQGSLRDVYVV